MSTKLVEVDTKTFIRFWLVIAAIFLVGLFLWQARTGLILVGLSIFLAVALRPLVSKVQKLSKNKLSKNSASVLTVGGLVLVFGVLFATIGPMIVGETVKFFSNTSEMLAENNALAALDSLGQNFGIENLSSELVAMVKNFGGEIAASISGSVITSVSVLLNFLTGAVLVIVLTILCLTQGPGLMNNFWKKIDGRNGKTGTVVRRVTIKIADVISRFMGGQVMVALIDSVVVGIVTFIMSLIFGFSSGLVFPLAMLALLFVMIPMFGTLIAAVVISLIMLFQSPIAGLTFLVFYAVYQQIESNVISPRIQANSLELPSLAILIAVTIGMYTFGLAGAIISIPVAGIIKVLVDEYPAIRALEQ